MYSKKDFIGSILLTIVSLNFIIISSAKPGNPSQGIRKVKANYAENGDVLKKDTMPPSVNTYISGEKSLSRAASKSNVNISDSTDETIKSIDSDMTIQKIQLPNLVPKRDSTNP